MPSQLCEVFSVYEIAVASEKKQGTGIPLLTNTRQFIQGKTAINHAQMAENQSKTW